MHDLLLSKKYAYVLSEQFKALIYSIVGFKHKPLLFMNDLLHETQLVALATI